MQTKIYRILGVVVLVVLVGMFVTRVSDTPKEGANLSKKPIKIGASISLTGVAADFGSMSKKAMGLAVEEINAKGGIEGRKVELIIEDDQTDPKVAVSAYRKLVDIEKADAVVGGIFDFTAQPIFPLALQDKITFVSPVNFLIRDAFEMNAYTFVMYPRFEKVVSELQSVIDGKNIQTLGMIRYESGFGKSIQQTLAQIMSNLQRKPLVTETYLAIGSSDFRTNILKLKDKNLDAVFLDMLDFDIVKYLNVSKSLGFNKQIIAYTTLRDVLQKKDIDLSGLDGAIMLDWEVPSADFIQAFTARYGEAPRRGANKSYDAVYVLAEAVANTNSKAEVPGYIGNRAFKTRNGEFSFDSGHAVKDTPVKVFEVNGGKLVEVKSHE